MIKKTTKYHSCNQQLFEANSFFASLLIWWHRDVTCKLSNISRMTCNCNTRFSGEGLKIISEDSDLCTLTA